MKGSQSRGQRMWGRGSRDYGRRKSGEREKSQSRAWHRAVELTLNAGKPLGCECLDLTWIHSRQSMDRGSSESSYEESTKPSAIQVPGRGQGRWDVLWAWRSKKGEGQHGRGDIMLKSIRISLWTTWIPFLGPGSPVWGIQAVKHFKWYDLQFILHSKTRGQREAPVWSPSVTLGQTACCGPNYDGSASFHDDATQTTDKTDTQMNRYKHTQTSADAYALLRW